MTATRDARAAGWEVVILDHEGRDVANVSNHEGIDGWPAWSPDGRRLVFASERGGSSDLWLVDADGSNLEQLTRNPGACVSASSRSWVFRGKRALP